jgi:Phage tail tube protein
MAKINGTSVKLYAAGTVIDNLTKVDFETSRGMIDVTTKDSNHWKEILPGLMEAKFSGDGIVDFASTNKKPSDLFTYLTAGTSVAMLFYDAISGDKQYSATGYFSKFNISSGVEDAVKFSYEIVVTGTATQSSIT